MTKYSFLTKDILQQDYDDLGSLSAIGRKYSMPIGSVKSIARRFNITMDLPGGKCKYEIDENIFSKDSEKGFYIAGFIAADGNIFPSKHYNGSACTITLSQEDKEHLIKIKELLQFTGNIVDGYSFNKDYGPSFWSKMVIYCSQKIIVDLENNFNIVPQKTFTYEFPDKLINHNMIRHFIRGYFDGDGCFYINKRDQNVCFELLGRQDFLKIVMMILNRELDLQSKAKIGKIKNIYRLRYAGDRLVTKIANYLYGDSNIFLQRKYDKISHLIK